MSLIHREVIDRVEQKYSDLLSKMGVTITAIGT